VNISPETTNICLQKDVFIQTRHEHQTLSVKVA